MSGIFERYHECSEMVSAMPDGTSKTHAEAILRQLLHIEQARKVAHDNYNRYRDEMNSWENNLVGNIKDMVKEATNGRPD